MSTPAARTPRTAPPAVTIGEHRAWRIDGFVALFLAVVLLLGGGVLFIVLGVSGPPLRALWAGVPLIVGVGLAAGLVIVAPNEACVVEFFGRYIGTVRRAGLSSIVPLTRRQRVSLRVRNFETSTLKVNDASGNPIEVAAIVVWQVWDAAKAVYAVDDYEEFVAIQAEAGLRHIATSHPYDTGAAETSLRGSTDVVAAELAEEVSQRTGLAGVQVVEVRISHLAYAPEIAQAMLRKQQAAAVVAARALIVEGAVGMVETALKALGEKEIVDLDEERKATMVSNLMVVLCSDQPASPIVNAGTLYS
ncbi:MAG: SPFH domain-containing protein [Microbacterium sp.]